MLTAEIDSSLSIALLCTVFQADQKGRTCSYEQVRSSEMLLILKDI